MKLYKYYKYIYNFDCLSKKKKKYIYHLVVKAPDFNSTYLNYIVLQFITNQKFCLFDHKVTLRNKNFWSLIENSVSSVTINKKKITRLFNYCMNSLIYKILHVNIDLVTKLLQNLSVVIIKNSSGE